MRYGIMGYSRQLLIVLTEACYELVPYEQCDDSPPFRVWRAQAERHRYRRELVEGLWSKTHYNRELNQHYEDMYEAIDDPDLKAMIDRGNMVSLEVFKNGTFAAVEEVVEDETDPGQLWQDPLLRNRRR